MFSFDSGRCHKRRLAAFQSSNCIERFLPIVLIDGIVPPGSSGLQFRIHPLLLVRVRLASAA